jgi:outer membrane beta-barrel protein
MKGRILMVAKHLPDPAPGLRTFAALVLLGLWTSAAFAFPQDGAPAPDSLAVAVEPAGSTDTAPLGDSTAVKPAAKPMNAPLQVGSRRVRLTGAARNVVRSGPGDTYAVVGVYKAKAEFPVFAKSGDWIGVKLSDTETGWVHHSLCKEMDDMSGLEFKPNPRLYSRTGSFMLEGYAGGYAFDQKSNSFVAGGRLGYYVFDRLIVEGGLSWTHVYRPAEIVESLFSLSLEAEDFHMMSYQFMATYEILPGRQMVPYLSVGLGSSVMQGESEPAWNFGAGTTMYLSRRTAVRWEVRGYHFETGSANTRQSHDNVELTLGSVYLF